MTINTYPVKWLPTLFLGLILGGCTGQLSSDRPNQTLNPQQERKVIFTTFTVLADMAQNVAGDKVIVTSLTKIGSEIHGYEPTPSDLVRASKASLILDNGFGLERWAEKFYSNLNNVPHVTLSTGITPILISSDAYTGKPNPHAWMSPTNALIYVENIRKALVEFDPANTATFNANAKSYSQAIANIDQKLRQTIATMPNNQRYLVTCEGAFSYLAKDYGLQELYLWSVNADVQGTPQQIRRVIDKVKSERIPVIFCESTVNANAQREVAKQTGAKFGGVFYVDSLSAKDGVAPTYLKLLESNVNTLVGQGSKS
jgi:manganese transport system substrate-binding protein